MKFNCGKKRDWLKDYDAAVDYWRQWRPWFAWRPVRVGDDDCRWLETVERRANTVYTGGLVFVYTPTDFEYREVAE